jgi:YidC/Oxa1 family membrane protein insertase
LADYQNPQQEPGSERRLLIVVVLTFVVLVASQALLKKYMPSAPAQPENHSVQAQPAPASPSSVPATTAAPLPSTTVTKQASTESETVIENDLYKITFTNRGAQVKSWILKKFDNDAQNGPLDLVNAAAAKTYRYPLSLWTYDEDNMGAKIGKITDLSASDGVVTLSVANSMSPGDVVSLAGLTNNAALNTGWAGTMPQVILTATTPTTVSFAYREKEDKDGEKIKNGAETGTVTDSLRNRLNSALYVASSEGNLTAPAMITFEYADQDLLVRKSFRFDHTYVLNVETSVVYKGTEIFAPPAWPAGFGDQVTAPAYAAARIDYHNDASTERTALVFPSYVSRLGIKSISGGNTIKAPFEWAGTGDQYFTAIFIPDDPTTAAMVTLRDAMEIPQKPGFNPVGASAKDTANVELLGAAVGNLRGRTTERMYVGPKELAVLDAVPVPTIKNDSPDLRGIVDFGWWGILSRPLFLWLKWTYNHIVHNWGWAIVIQTFIITVLLLPLRITQMKSMLKMQRIQPQIKNIQEKYKKYTLRDPRKAGMQEEISALYKKEGVNPAGGCLPMLIQFPFLIAYYRMLGVALELRHAHWLWITDLSASDWVLPLLMVVSMIVVQRMTPQAGMDPAQQKMMTVMMPLMMGFIFFKLAAGLNLYYTESNLISIAQQAVMNRTKLGREMREMLEKRARKKDK